MSWTTHSNYLYRDDIGLFLALLAAARQEIKDAGLTVVEGPSNVIDGDYIIQSQERWPDADHPLPKIEHWFAFPADHPTPAEKQAFLATIAQYRGAPCPPRPAPKPRYTFTTTATW